ncbi:hypothetical protein GALMADRAFT_1159643 [Galerina marginata CBS 339.88]|uniref:Uncharacterized protein n=1 Tax=Galerina marginata (strain CBS 339.88) TaxID=685588 RepID=A0A067S6A4_GALM3|nr:hypothetical protein GALMADRAFT_1159643 [Galerina marginata CBS 339.88]
MTINMSVILPTYTVQLMSYGTRCLRMVCSIGPCSKHSTFPSLLDVSTGHHWSPLKVGGGEKHIVTLGCSGGQ